MSVISPRVPAPATGLWHAPKYQTYPPYYYYRPIIRHPCSIKSDPPSSRQTVPGWDVMSATSIDLGTYPATDLQRRGSLDIGSVCHGASRALVDQKPPWRLGNLSRLSSSPPPCAT